MICKYCGANNGESSKFCENCGKVIVFENGTNNSLDYRTDNNSYTSNYSYSNEYNSYSLNGYANENTYKKNTNTENKKPMSAVARIFIGLFSILFFFVFCALISVSLAKSFFTKDTLVEFANEIDILDMKAQDLFNDNRNEENTVLDYICDEVMEETDVISKEELKEVIEVSGMKDYFEKVFSEYFASIIYSEEYSINYAEDMMELIKKNEAKIEKSIGREITDEDYIELEETFADDEKTINREFNSNRIGQEDDFEEILDIMNGKGLKAATTALIAIALSIVALMLLISKRITTVLMGLSIPITLVGILLLFLSKVFKDLLADDEAIIQKMVDYFGGKILVMGVVLVFIGIIMLLMRYIIKHKLIAKEERQYYVNDSK